MIPEKNPGYEDLYEGNFRLINDLYSRDIDVY